MLVLMLYACARVQHASRSVHVKTACRWTDGALCSQEGEVKDQTKQEKDNKAVILKAKSPELKTCLYDVYCRLMKCMRDTMDRPTGASLTLGKMMMPHARACSTLPSDAKSQSSLMPKMDRQSKTWTHASR